MLENVGKCWKIYKVNLKYKININKMDFECEFCHKKFKNKSSINNHKATANYCLKNTR